MAAKRRRSSSRPQRQFAQRILVVTEGTLTEPQYIEGLQQFLRSKCANATVKTVSVGKDPLRVVQKCIKLRNGALQKDKERFDHCVCLVDVDKHQTLRAAIELAKQEGIKLLISNLKFEVWLRWHAENKRSALSSAQLDEVVSKLDLVKGKTLSPRFPYGSVQNACKTARAADPEMRSGRKGPDPSSSMPILIDLLQGK